MINIGKTIVSARAEALDITSLHLSGSLGKSTGCARLMADVNDMALKKPFKISVDLDLSKVVNFLTAIFRGETSTC